LIAFPQHVLYRPAMGHSSGENQTSSAPSTETPWFIRGVSLSGHAPPIWHRLEKLPKVISGIRSLGIVAAILRHQRQGFRQFFRRAS
jgi:hypothetical protein